MLLPRFRLSSSLVILLLGIQTIAFIFVYMQQDVYKPQPEEEQGKVHILIISSWRSGSSFVGQTFSQHPDVFYLMEPGWHVWVNMFKNGARVLHMAVRDLIRSVFLCDMSVFDVYMQPNKNTSDLFMWGVSRALCSPPACDFYQRTDITTESVCKTMCGKYPFSKVEEACKTYSHIVLKEVRFFDLKVLYPLLTDPSLNLKIIHLVRDPRAVVRSREQAARALARDNGIVLNTGGMSVNDSKYGVMKEICTSHVKIYETATKDPANFLKDRYMLLRYEDLARDPLLEIREMYRFSDLRMTSKIQEWIFNVTHGTGERKKSDAFKTTSRDAMNISQAWRIKLPFQKVEQIQNVCRRAMELMGYQLVLNEHEQKDLSFDLVLPRKRYQFTWALKKEK
ncbi:carbohydrate sulfotransferase 6 [Latimeria chalumnae]|uniref:Sulfotransferase n=1 Tax=Latimeria chalumnae TaxID=7897 RepID=H2ZXJ2_LATCH|nr:PREDICTED: carbohydrate sulfotransferase 5-like [Latimeria chalumnae]|eukprot:XP_006012567.1 PREDICTED: carbohydrate sulfotransferase 5-like [Latimeria chalumnae]